MKIPRDLSGSELVKALRAPGYERVLQDGSHIRLTTQQGNQHHVTVPNHNPIKLGHADRNPQGSRRAPQADP